MIISAIVATDLNNAIGKNNQLLWHLPADLKFFKQITMGCPVIMGRKTFESIGRLLPGRKNIIITRNKSYNVAGAIVVNSIEEAISTCNDEKVFVIGGAEIYKMAMPFLNEIYRTLVDHKFEADTFFSEIDTEQYEKTFSEKHNADEKNKYAYCFEKWQRKNHSVLL
ncbi:MAG: dihydrofolate reductase [Bacteroidetes bacterium]|nr:dihydrofolate reductase [Bacteroidota bacterium]